MVSRLRCPICDESVEVKANGRPMCRECGWGDDLPPEPGTLAGDYPLENEATGDEDQEEDRGKFAGYGGSLGFVLAIGLIATIWAILGWYATQVQEVAIWLIFAGLSVAVVGAFWLYSAAVEEGAERLNLLDGSTRSLAGLLILALIELVAIPIFSVICLILYFDATWKPFLIELAGVGMVIHGVMLVIGP